MGTNSCFPHEILEGIVSLIEDRSALIAMMCGFKPVNVYVGLPVATQACR